jgi:hypothetical protein
MDGARFDALTRALRRRGSRRGALGALTLAAFAPLGGAARPEPAKCLTIGERCRLAAEPPQAPHHGKGKKGKGKHHPPSCSKCCSRLGSADPNGKARCTCKGEGIACDNPSQCCSGQCRDGACTACLPNTVFCSDGCANLQTDANHCGSCEHACDSGQRCQDGTCVCPSGVICSVGGCCANANDVCDQNDQCCSPESPAAACNGQCGVVQNNCNQPVDCVGQSCAPIDGFTDEAICQADGRCCVPDGRNCGGDQGCSAANCCSGLCFCSDQGAHSCFPS